MPSLSVSSLLGHQRRMYSLRQSLATKLTLQHLSTMKPRYRTAILMLVHTLDNLGSRLNFVTRSAVVY